MYIFWATRGKVFVFKIVVNLVNYLESCFRKYYSVFIEGALLTEIIFVWIMKTLKT